MLRSAHRLVPSHRMKLAVIVSVAVTIAVGTGLAVTLRSANRDARHDTGTVHHQAGSGVRPVAGISTVSCPPMTDGADVAITRSCQIDRDVTAGNVMIADGATVSVADKDLTLTVRSLMVLGEGSRFLAGCPRPLTARLRIVVSETDRQADVNGAGAGAIGGMGGDFCLVGAYDGPGFSPLAATVPAGATSVTTKQPLRVRPGQRIALATTDRVIDHSEVLTVTAVSADGRTLSVKPAARIQHTCASRSYRGGKSITMCADVAALDRNIEVSPAAGAVGHVVFMGGGVDQIGGVHFDRMGYAKAKYGGVHFHLKGNAPTSFMARNSCTNAGARCYVIHATDNSSMVDNVAFNTTCTAILAGEDGVETGNVYRHNLALNTKPCAIEDFDGGSTGPSGIWSAAANQRFYDNHVAGNVGFGFHMDVGRFLKPRGLSASRPVSPAAAHIGAFVGLTVYSIVDGGNPNRCPEAECGSGLKIDMNGRVNGCWPDQANKAWRCGAGAFPYYSFGRNNMFYDVTVWNVDAAGVWGERGFGLRNAAVSDTRDGLWLQDGHTDDSLIVGNSGAVTNPDPSRQCTRIYDFKTVVTGTTFANCGTGRIEGAAIDTNFSHTDGDSGISAFAGITLDNSRPFFAQGGARPDRCPKGDGTIAWLLDNSTGYGPGHLEYACGPGAGVTQPGWNGVKVVTARPQRAELYDGTRQHADPNLVGIPKLPAPPAVPAPSLPALIGA
jgi:hypothetical protein